MDERRQFGRRGAMLLIGLLAACTLTLGASIMLIPPRLQSHEDQVAYALTRHQIAFEQVKLSQTPRDVQYTYAYADYSQYGADVIVRFHDGGRALGRIECRVKNTKCQLLLKPLGMINEQLPELDTGDQWFWWDWLVRKLPKFS
jgi:hypothetical protein